MASLLLTHSGHRLASRVTGKSLILWPSYHPGLDHVHNKAVDFRQADDAVSILKTSRQEAVNAISPRISPGTEVRALSSFFHSDFKPLPQDWQTMVQTQGATIEKERLLESINPKCFKSSSTCSAWKRLAGGKGPAGFRSGIECTFPSANCTNKLAGPCSGVEVSA